MLVALCCICCCKEVSADYEFCWEKLLCWACCLLLDAVSCLLSIFEGIECVGEGIWGCYIVEWLARASSVLSETFRCSMVVLYMPVTVAEEEEVAICSGSCICERHSCW